MATSERKAGMTLQEIADVSGVAVGTVHGAVTEFFKNEKLDQPAKVVGKDGKARPTSYKPRQAPPATALAVNGGAEKRVG